MADSSIEWTNKVWNPTLGCERVSTGCGAAERGGCYAERLAFRLAAMGKTEYEGLTHRLPDGKVRWTGKVVCLPERLAQPLAWKKPARIFVDSMSDLFHEDVPLDFIERVFRTMAAADWHTFQILTKRPERMRVLVPMVYDRMYGYVDHEPLGNIWLGVSVEDQRAADERIPLLLQTPAVVRFLSCEPLLGPLSLRRWLGLEPTVSGGWMQIAPGDALNWVIAGGESGPGYRPMDLDWIRSLRDQCAAAGVAFFAKQNSGPRTHMWLPEDLQSHEFPEPRRELAHV